MVLLPEQFNTADLPDTSGSSVLIPEGDYPAIIVKSELVENRNKNGSFLALTVVITQGEYANTEFIERLNIVNPNSQAVEIAYKVLARISESLGMTQTPKYSTEIHNKPLMIRVKTETGKPWTDKAGVQREGKDKSVIKKYLPVPAGGSEFGGAPAPAAAAGTPPALAAAAPPAPASAPASNPFASPAS